MSRDTYQSIFGYILDSYLRVIFRRHGIRENFKRLTLCCTWSNRLTPIRHKTSICGNIHLPGLMINCNIRYRIVRNWRVFCFEMMIDSSNMVIDLVNPLVRTDPFSISGINSDRFNIFISQQHSHPTIDFDHWFTSLAYIIQSKVTTLEHHWPCLSTYPYSSLMIYDYIINPSIVKSRPVSYGGTGNDQARLIILIAFPIIGPKNQQTLLSDRHPYIFIFIHDQVLDC